MNKKGAAHNILILVILTLVLTSTSLLIFYTNMREINGTIGDTRFVDNIYNFELSYETELREKIYSRFIELYYQNNIENFLSDESFSMQLSEIKILDKSTNTEKKVNVNLTEDEIIAIIEEFPISGNLLIRDKVRTWMWGFIPVASYEEQKAMLGVIYRPQIKVWLNISEMGLHPQKEIKNALLICKYETLSETEECLKSKLFNFDMTVVLEDGRYTVNMKSKNKYLINKEIKKIEFNTIL